VVRGHGNDGDSGEEGAVTANCFGSYLHGSVLPKNPHFADELIRRALRRRHGDHIALDPLDDYLELKAADVAADRP
jgi:CobQ-like glutamine amidotransferase family enzyme